MGLSLVLLTNEVLRVADEVLSVADESEILLFNCVNFET